MNEICPSIKTSDEFYIFWIFMSNLLILTHEKIKPSNMGEMMIKELKMPVGCLLLTWLKLLLFYFKLSTWVKIIYLHDLKKTASLLRYNSYATYYNI